MRQFIARMGRYTLVRVVTLVLAVIVAVYLTVIIANMGGEMDRVKKAQIQFEVGMAVYMDPANRALPASVLQEMVKEMAELEFRRLGLDEPFFPGRSLRYLTNALTLQLGRAEFMTSDAGSRQVRLILVERLPSTLILFATAQLLLFLLALFVALFLSRRYGSFLDRLTIALAPSSAAPGWFYGIFLIYSSEDYVELAKAKGLSSQAIERRYILRPTLPPIITSFMLVAITMWMGQIVLEYVFKWPGIGQAYYSAVQVGDTPVIVGVIVIYGYLLAATVFLLDFVYAILDPRVRVGIGR